ncbi:hypothetical protein C404_25385 [Ralstonia sp. AU12-08]|nr:hypothetical protein C404_25385 [Ralstonia sp. AU12-08]
MATVEVASNDNAAAGGSSALYFTLQRLEAGGWFRVVVGVERVHGRRSVVGLGFPGLLENAKK